MDRAIGTVTATLITIAFLFVPAGAVYLIRTFRERSLAAPVDVRADDQAEVPENDNSMLSNEEQAADHQVDQPGAAGDHNSTRSCHSGVME